MRLKFKAGIASATLLATATQLNISNFLFLFLAQIGFRKLVSIYNEASKGLVSEERRSLSQLKHLTKRVGFSFDAKSKFLSLDEISMSGGKAQ